MPQAQRAGQAEDFGGTGQRRAETVVHALAALGGRGESLAEVAHDARNMVTALVLYCDLLEEPGVLAVPFAHYSAELRLVAAASRRLVEKLAALDVEQSSAGASAHPELARLEPGRLEFAHLDTAYLDTAHLAPACFEPARMAPTAAAAEGEPGSAAAQAVAGSLYRQPVTAPMAASGSGPSSGPDSGPRSGASFSAALPGGRNWESLFAKPVEDLAAELAANRNLLSALAGPGIAVALNTAGGTGPVRLTAEDLTRLLVNLVKNASEAMPSGGAIEIALRQSAGSGAEPRRMVLTVDDTGPGIAPDILEAIFSSGFSTHGAGHRQGAARHGGWPVMHRGLGLAISRSLVESAGGTITAANHPSGSGGARFTIELPIRIP
jgi:signal transduction histidine kinase